MVLADFLRDDAGTVFPVSGRSLRADGDSHLEAWYEIVRGDVCAYCGRTGGTVDHIEARSLPARGLGGRASWLNTIGACQPCNGSKAARPLLLFLLSRAGGFVPGEKEKRTPPKSRLRKKNPVRRPTGVA